MTQEQAFDKLNSPYTPGTFSINGSTIVWKYIFGFDGDAQSLKRDEERARYAVTAYLSNNVIVTPTRHDALEATFCIFLKDNLW